MCNPSLLVHDPTVPSLISRQIPKISKVLDLDIPASTIKIQQFSFGVKQHKNEKLILGGWRKMTLNLKRMLISEHQLVKKF